MREVKLTCSYRSTNCAVLNKEPVQPDEDYDGVAGGEGVGQVEGRLDVGHQSARHLLDYWLDIYVKIDRQ